MKKITTTELIAHFDDPILRLIDVRSPDAYNGWKLDKECRGGHIKSAKSLPFKWLGYIDWLDIVNSKKIYPKHKIVLYGCSNEETEKVAKQFERAGYKNVRIYYEFTSRWNATSDLPMCRLERYRHLVSPEWLAGLIKHGKADELENQDYIICHAHYQNKAAYDKGHIPGAIDLDTNLLESAETWNRRSPAEIKRVLRNLGISDTTTVILYGRFSSPDNNDPFPGSSAGQLAAMRCAFIMLWAGVKDLRVLNGGLQSWKDAGLRTAHKETLPQKAADFDLEIPACPQYAVDLPEAKKMIRSDNANLVCVRSWKEYIGEVSGYNYIEKKGRIPDAVFGNCGSDAYHMENYRNLDHTMREFTEIEQLWAEAGITLDKHNAFYCGTGWRGSEAFFYAWLMGWPRVSVFDGGWFEWSKDPRNPTEKGIPE